MNFVHKDSDAFSKTSDEEHYLSHSIMLSQRLICSEATLKTLHFDQLPCRISLNNSLWDHLRVDGSEEEEIKNSKSVL